MPDDASDAVKSGDSVHRCDALDDRPVPGPLVLRNSSPATCACLKAWHVLDVLVQVEMERVRRG